MTEVMASSAKTATVTTRTYSALLCLGKALPGGYLMLGAMLTTNEVACEISLGGEVFMHGPTFMANPLACLVLLASINLLMSLPWEEQVRGWRGD